MQVPYTVDWFQVFLAQILPSLGIFMVPNLSGLVNSRAGEFPLRSCFRQAEGHHEERRFFYFIFFIIITFFFFIIFSFF